MVKSLNEENTVFNIGGYIFDSILRIVKDQDNNEIYLPEKESALLKAFCTSKNGLIRRDDVLMEIWGDITINSRRKMDVYISSLRRKLEKNDNIRIKTISDLGHRLFVTSTFDPFLIKNDDQSEFEKNIDKCISELLKEEVKLRFKLLSSDDLYKDILEDEIIKSSSKIKELMEMKEWYINKK